MRIGRHRSADKRNEFSHQGVLACSSETCCDDSNGKLTKPPRCDITVAHLSRYTRQEAEDKESEVTEKRKKKQKRSAHNSEDPCCASPFTRKKRRERGRG